MGNYAILANFLGPIKESTEEERVNQIWHMHFDGAFCWNTERGGESVFANNKKNLWSRASC